MYKKGFISKKKFKKVLLKGLKSCCLGDFDGFWFGEGKGGGNLDRGEFHVREIMEMENLNTITRLR